MKCLSCNVEIPPAWVACIQNNICPACGGNIMDTEAQEFLRELTDILAQLPNDPEGIAGWLLSNYQMKKVGDGEPTGFLGRKSKLGSGNDPGSMKMHHKKFFDNANIDIKTLNKNSERYKQMMLEISAGGGYEDLDEDQEEYEQEEPQQLEPEDEYEKKAVEQMKKFKFSKDKMAHLKKTMSEEQADIPVGGNDLAKYFTNDRLKRIEDQNRIGSGEKVGLIARRSSE